MLEAEQEKRLAALKGQVQAAQMQAALSAARLADLRQRLTERSAGVGAQPADPLAQIQDEAAQLREEVAAVAAAAAGLLPTGLAPASAAPVASAPGSPAPGSGSEPAAPLRPEQLRQRLITAQIALSRQKGQAERIRHDQAETAARLAANQEQMALLDQVALLLQQTAQHARAQARERIEALVSATLQSVFGPAYSFHIELVEKAGRTDAEFYVTSPVAGVLLQSRPQDARGGGVVDIVSLGLRVAMLETYQPHLEGALILDEPAKHVSEEYIESAAAYFASISQAFDRQVIMVTHNPHLAETAAVAYQVVLKEERSTVTRLR